MKDVSVILPSYKPDEKLLKTVTELEKSGFEDIIVVDDGGGAEYNEKFEEIRKRESCTVLVHPQNRGKGAALKTAFKWYLENRSGLGVVTVDGDGQHRPDDVIATVNEMRKTGDVVLGVRDFSLPDVPARSRFGNNCTSGIFRLFVHMKVSDTQTGLRAIPLKCLESLLSVSGDRYEYETNMLLYMKRFGYSFTEVKITTVYLNENETSHFRPVRDSLRIYSLIFKFFFTSSFVKFFGSSLLCYFIDSGLFLLFGMIITHTALSTKLDVTFGIFGFTFALAYVIQFGAARLISSLVNYSLNRKIFKGQKSSVAKTILKYYILAIFIFVTGSLGGSFVYGALIKNASVAQAFPTDSSKEFLKLCVKLPIDGLLYILSYSVQKKFIFNTSNNKNH